MAMDGWCVETGVKVFKHTFTTDLGRAPGAWDVRHQGHAGLNGQMEIFMGFPCPFSPTGLLCI